MTGFLSAALKPPGPLAVTKPPPPQQRQKLQKHDSTTYEAYMIFVLCLLCLFVASLECFLVKIYQFHRRHGGFKPFVA